MTIDYEEFLKGFCVVVPEHKEVKKNEEGLLIIEPKSYVNPTSTFDAEFAKSQLGVDSVDELVEMATNFVVETDKEAQKGLSMALQARDLNKTIETTRKALVRPHIDFQKSLKTFADAFRMKLQEIEESLQKKVEDYQQKRKEDLKEHGIDDASFDTLSVEEGSSTTKTTWEFKLDDIEKVPMQYLQLNEKLVKEAIKLGHREIPGIEIFEVKKKRYKLKGAKK